MRAKRERLSGSDGDSQDPRQGRNWATYTNRPFDEHYDVRGAELNRVVDLLNPQQGDTIVEYGCAHGALTHLLADAVGPDGRVIALDVNSQLTSTLRHSRPNVKVKHVKNPKLPVKDDSADGVASIATLHHVPVSKQPALFQEFERVLKPGKPAVVADVAKRTRVAEYFDTEVDQTSRAGHKFPFLDMRDFAALCKSARLDIQQWQIESVPWIFDELAQAGRFLKDMHDATIPPTQCLRSAGRILGIHANTEAQLILGWQLFFAKAVKRTSSLPE